MGALSQQDRDSLASDAEQGGDLLHGHALRMQGPRLGPAQPGAHPNKIVEVLTRDLVDQGALVDEDLPVAPAEASQPLDRLSPAHRCLVEDCALVENSQQRVEGPEHLIALVGPCQFVLLAVPKVAKAPALAKGGKHDNTALVGP